MSFWAAGPFPPPEKVQHTSVQERHGVVCCESDQQHHAGWGSTEVLWVVEFSPTCIFISLNCSAFSSSSFTPSCSCTLVCGSLYCSFVTKLLLYLCWSHKEEPTWVLGHAFS